MSDFKVLTENYKRFFGDMDECDFSGRKVVNNTKKTIQLSEAQTAKWMKIHKSFTNQNPNRKLTMVDGQVKLDGFLVESADKFIARDAGSMVQVLRNANRNILKG